MATKRGRRGKAAQQPKDAQQEPEEPAVPATATKVPSSPLAILSKVLTPRAKQQATPGKEDVSFSRDQTPPIPEDAPVGEFQEVTPSNDVTDAGRDHDQTAPEGFSQGDPSTIQPPHVSHAGYNSTALKQLAKDYATRFAQILQRLSPATKAAAVAAIILLAVVISQSMTLKRQAAAMQTHDQQLYVQNEALRILQSSFTGIMKQLEQLPELSNLDTATAECSSSLTQLSNQQQALQQQLHSFKDSVQTLSTQVSEASSTAAAAVSLHQSTPPPLKGPTMDELSQHIQQTLQSQLPDLLYAQKDLAVSTCGAIVSSHSKLAYKPNLPMTLHSYIRRNYLQSSDTHPLANQLLLSAKQQPGKCLRLGLGEPSAPAPAYVDILLPGKALVTSVSLYLPKGFTVPSAADGAAADIAAWKSTGGPEPSSRAGSNHQQQHLLQQQQQQQQAAAVSVSNVATTAEGSPPILPGTFPRLIFVNALNSSSSLPEPPDAIAAATAATAANPAATAFTVSPEAVAAGKGRIVVQLKAPLVADLVRVVVLSSMDGGVEACLNRIGVHGKPVESQAGLFLC